MLDRDAAGAALAIPPPTGAVHAVDDMEGRGQLRPGPRASATGTGHAHRQALVPDARSPLDGPDRLPARQQAHRPRGRARRHRARLRIREGTLRGPQRRGDPRGQSRVDAERRHPHLRGGLGRLLPLSRHALLPGARPPWREGLCAAARRAGRDRADRHRAGGDARPAAPGRADPGGPGARARHATLAGRVAPARRAAGGRQARTRRGPQRQGAQDGAEADRGHVGRLAARRVPRHVSRGHPRPGRSQGEGGQVEDHRDAARDPAVDGGFECARPDRAAAAQPRRRGARRGSARDGEAEEAAPRKRAGKAAGAARNGKAAKVTKATKAAKATKGAAARKSAAKPTAAGKSTASKSKPTAAGSAKRKAKAAGSTATRKGAAAGTGHKRAA